MQLRCGKVALHRPPPGPRAHMRAVDMPTLVNEFTAADHSTDNAHKQAAEGRAGRSPQEACQH